MNEQSEVLTDCAFLEAVKSANAHLPTGNWQDVVNILAKSNPKLKSESSVALVRRYSQLYNDFSAKYLESGQPVNLGFLTPNESLLCQLIREAAPPKGIKIPFYLSTCDVATTIAALKIFQTCRLQLRSAEVNFLGRLKQARNLLVSALPHCAIPSTDLLHRQFVELLRCPSFNRMGIVQEMSAEYKKNSFFGSDDSLDPLYDAYVNLSSDAMLTLLNIVETNSAHLQFGEKKHCEQTWLRVHRCYKATSISKQWPLNFTQLKSRYHLYREEVRSKYVFKLDDGTRFIRWPHQYTPLTERRMFELIISTRSSRTKCVQISNSDKSAPSVAVSVNEDPVQVILDLPSSPPQPPANSAARSSTILSAVAHNHVDSAPLVPICPILPFVHLNAASGLEQSYSDVEVDDEIDEQHAIALFDQHSSNMLLPCAGRKRRLVAHDDIQDDSGSEGNSQNYQKKRKHSGHSLEYMLLLKEVRFAELEKVRVQCAADVRCAELKAESDWYQLEKERVKLAQLLEHNKLNHVA